MTRPGAPLGDLFARAVRQSIGGTAAAGDAGADPTVDRILDAAVAVLGRRGTTEATVDEVAQEAGVGRATVFRRFASKDTLFEAALTRVVGGVIGAMVDRFAVVRDPVEQVVEGFAICMALDADPLLAGSRRRRADLLAALCDGDPSPLSLAFHAVAANLRRAHRDGAITVGDPDQQADALVHLGLAYLVAPGLAIDLADPDAVRAFARSTIAPVIGYVPETASRVVASDS
ncbi:TetR/AcrR family transcriptional regulator [Williamsia serinedens]|uniref:Transcriptional regulator, TetR family n=1 Tax=Williamsia serinedens TaxID=391736 RepID=A0ABT1GXX0_9NOCA|nr:TetR/AcrR family transcriptional regulator [Williamsia serinedens]MCP2159831.1 transcriptional regulator, TetR family [Williamsia serinedens]